MLFTNFTLRDIGLECDGFIKKRRVYFVVLSHSNYQTTSIVKNLANCLIKADAYPPCRTHTRTWPQVEISTEINNFYFAVNTGLPETITYFTLFTWVNQHFKIKLIGTYDIDKYLDFETIVTVYTYLFDFFVTMQFTPGARYETYYEFLMLLAIQYHRNGLFHILFSLH